MPRLPLPLCLLLFFLLACPAFAQDPPNAAAVTDKIGQEIGSATL